MKEFLYLTLTGSKDSEMQALSHFISKFFIFLFFFNDRSIKGFIKTCLYSVICVFLECVHTSILCAVLLFRTTSCLNELRKLACVTVVDNSILGRKAVLNGKKVKIQHVYNPKQVGGIGDRVLLSIMGQKKHAYIVGCKQKQKRMVPRFDSNNVVLVEENGTPTGTRIRVPIPSALRGVRDQGGQFTKILSIATTFI